MEKIYSRIECPKNANSCELCEAEKDCREEKYLDCSFGQFYFLSKNTIKTLAECGRKGAEAAANLLLSLSKINLRIIINNNMNSDDHTTTDYNKIYITPDTIVIDEIEPEIRIINQKIIYEFPDNKILPSCCVKNK
jgi:hypothetical protein